MEIWCNIQEFDLYEVSNLGRVRNRITKCIIVGSKSKGYISVGLFKNGKSWCRKIHRLVALAFIPNPENKPQVNHLDGIRDNNNASNLEWCTNRENQLHSRQILNTPRIRYSKNKKEHHYKGKKGKEVPSSLPVRTTDINTGEVNIFESILECCLFLGNPNISKWINYNIKNKVPYKNYYIEKI